MKQNINIEAEGSELILKNKAGDYVIIPKKYRREVQDMLKDGCHGCIDSLVETLPVMEDYAQDGSLIPNDKKKYTFEYNPYTAVQDNTYVVPRVVTPLEQKKKQLPILKEQPVLKADTRTDQERKIAQEYTESVLNPSISTQIGEGLQKPLRWLADPVKGIGDVVSAIAPNSALAKDLPNTNEDTFEHRKKQLNPYTSNKEKINNTINEGIPLTNWALLNTLPVEAAAGNMIKSGKNLIKPVSKVVGKTDDVIKSTVYNEGENKILDFFTPKNTKKASSEFTFENIPDRKFNTLDDFKTKYKSDYQVTTDKRTFKGEPLDATKTGKEESNYFTRNVDDKIEKHYNNEITLQKFKDYGGDEKLFQTLIDNINTPSKTVQGSLNNASGLLTDEGVSLAVHNKYLDPNEVMQTLFHEKGHQSKIVASTKEGSLLPNLWEDISKLSGYSKYTSADKGSIGMYMSHPSEIYSRIMELKYKANLKPYENFTKELLEKIGGVERDASGKITRMSGLMPSSYSKNEELWLKLINKAPVLIPAIGSGMYFQSQKQNKTE